MKKFLVAVLVIILAGAGYYYYKVYFSSSKKFNPIYALPADAAYVLEFDDPLDAWKKISSSSVWSYMKTNPFLSELTHYADSLNGVISNNEVLSKMIASRPVIISGHPVKDKLEYFWIVDLKDASQFLGLRNLLLPAFEKYYSISLREYNGYEILELYDEEYHETIYMSIVENLLIGSYRHVLVEASLDQINEPVIGRDLDFIEVREQLGYNGLLRLYIQWGVMLDHMSEFIIDENTLSELSDIFKYSGFDFEYSEKDETLLFEGFTSMSDTVRSFLNMFHKTGSSSLSIPHLVPESTSFYSGLGFKDSETFSSYIKDMLFSDNDDLSKSREKLESFLDISLDEHFFSWMDDEMAAIQTHLGKDDEAGYSLVIKAKDGEDAMEKLAFIGERIKKKTPVKFKQIDYMGYEINFMSVKGFFKILFGRLFQRLDKPYYTIIDDYVIFSNHPNTLRNIIDNYSEGNTLAANEDFKTFRDHYSNKSAAFIYANPTYLIADSKSWLDMETYQSVMNAENYLLCFPMAGLQLTADDGLYENLLVVAYNQKALIKEEKPIVSLLNNSLDSLEIVNYDSLFRYSASVIGEEEMIFPEEIHPDDLDAKLHEEFYESGKIRVEVSIKDGVKHGTYREYAEEGYIILKGKFRNDLRDGLWKEYDKDGKVTNRVRYVDGELK